MLSLPVFEAERGLYVEDEAGHWQCDTTTVNKFWYLIVFLFSFDTCKAITDDSCVPNLFILGLDPQALLAHLCLGECA